MTRFFFSLLPFHFIQVITTIGFRNPFWLGDALRDLFQQGNGEKSMMVKTA